MKQKLCQQYVVKSKVVKSKVAKHFVIGIFPPGNGVRTL